MASDTVKRTPNLMETASFFLRIRATSILARNGLNKQQIAIALSCSERSVERYLSHGAKEREAAANRAVRSELSRDD